ncbi:MAG: alkaline phosphatase family protein [Planctomycetes bacterium]|nr:alkaline phosphatase family protein [Planctomycetota bacterium]
MPRAFPVTSSRAAGFVALVALLGLLGVGATAERAWFAAPLPLEAPDPAPARRGPWPALLLVVVDGLREAATPTMRTWQALASEGASGVARTGEPTMSAPCVRAIVTGRRPDLYTSFRNFAPVPVRGSVLDALVARGASLAHAGDRLLPNLLPDAYRDADVFVPPRTRYTEPGELDDDAWPFALEQAGDAEVDVLTVHLVTADLTAHRFGADGPAYAAAVAAVDRRLDELVLLFRRTRPGAYVLVAADHGLSPRGTHGGGEPEARRAPFVLVGPRVPKRRAVEIPQEALATTLAAVFRVPTPPLAEEPPALGLVRLDREDRRDALLGFLDARAAALAAAGRDLEARGVAERKAAALARATPSDVDAALLAAAMTSAATAPGPAPAAVAVLALLALVVAVLVARGGARAAVVAGGGLAALAAVAAAVAAAHHARLSAREVAPLATRALEAAAAVAGVAALAVALRGRRRDGAPPAGLVGGDAAPVGVVLVLIAGAAVALVRSCRLALDDALHAPWLSTAAAGVATAVAAMRARGASRAVRVAAPLVVTAVLVAARVVEAAGGEDVLARTQGVGCGLATGVALVVLVAVARRDAATVGAVAWGPAAAVGVFTALDGGVGAHGAAFALVAAAAVLASRLPARRGGAGLVVLVLLARVAVFHALGGAESLRRLDPDGAFVPGAAGVSGLRSVLAGLAPWVLREACTVALLVAAAAAALRRGRAAGGSGAVVTGLSLATVAGGAALAVVASAWARWAWWMAVAHPVFLLALVDASALVVVALLAAAWRGRGAAAAVETAP